MKPQVAEQTGPVMPGQVIPLRTPHWTQTHSGLAFDLTAQLPHQVNIHDIAAALAKQCRFAGACTQFYSVAQHSVIVADALKKHTPIVQLYGLLHDAHEAYIGDVIRPVKELVASVLPYDPFSALGDAVQRTIYAAFRLPEPSEAVRQLVHRADNQALATEQRDVMADPEREWGLTEAPLSRPIIPLPWPRAEEKFLQAFADLSVQAGLGVGRRS
ncbi:phosphohydrolase [Rhodomicrobium lacus]|uniref:phosphohydrolase n=1 Tax=Rhodomicrobium lacus TaxID=2498452 RepID=UPI000F8D3366|nr:phosphohydrolase [Rhodomicrobium lacus]